MHCYRETFYFFSSAGSGCDLEMSVRDIYRYTTCFDRIKPFHFASSTLHTHRLLVSDSAIISLKKCANFPMQNQNKAEKLAADTAIIWKVCGAFALHVCFTGCYQKPVVCALCVFFFINFYFGVGCAVLLCVARDFNDFKLRKVFDFSVVVSSVCVCSSEEKPKQFMQFGVFMYISSRCTIFLRFFVFFNIFKHQSIPPRRPVQQRN